MVPKVGERSRLGSDSLLNKGTWAFLAQFHEQEQPLFVVDIGTILRPSVRAKQIPVIVSPASGGFDIFRNDRRDPSSTAAKNMLRLRTDIDSYKHLQGQYTTDKTKYETLAEAYAAYKKQVEDDVRFQQYKDTLLK